MIRAVLLDALGTLVELEDPAPALASALGRAGVEVSVEEARDALVAEIVYYRAHHVDGGDAGRLADLRRRCAVVLGEALPAPVRTLDPGVLEGALLAALRFRAFADVAPALARLRADGLCLVVASNWDVSLHERLAEAGVAALVDGAVSSAEVGEAKPGAAIFARALEIAGAAAGQTLMVGDSVEHDVEGARAAGIGAVLLDRAGRGPAGPGTIRSLAELPALVESAA